VRPDDADREALLGLFPARERMRTTAVGDGVAIPHPRCPLVLGLPQSDVRLCFLAQPHDFGAPDGMLRLLGRIEADGEKSS
jgi:PTS system nitrogen regulatory IIA component